MARGPSPPSLRSPPPCTDRGLCRVRGAGDIRHQHPHYTDGGASSSSPSVLSVPLVAEAGKEVGDVGSGCGLRSSDGCHASRSAPHQNCYPFITQSAPSSSCPQHCARLRPAA
ncbi:hypothetical protein E2562_034322 [Oryza meyeriana var. granulata]|uniref:Uncharacterized protein n=1 Tax=Oryza meyeriana var. granulata TaxID=110450 RepID=A0A6G1FFD7_9ORYZ|nr:hypothetical protein E2562_034322 [Oryza meyeriana var. granulata]